MRPACRRRPTCKRNLPASGTICKRSDCMKTDLCQAEFPTHGCLRENSLDSPAPRAVERAIGVENLHKSSVIDAAQHQIMANVCEISGQDAADDGMARAQRGFDMGAIGPQLASAQAELRCALCHESPFGCAGGRIISGIGKSCHTRWIVIRVARDVHVDHAQGGGAAGVRAHGAAGVGTVCPSWVNLV